MRRSSSCWRLRSETWRISWPARGKHEEWRPRRWVSSFLLSRVFYIYSAASHMILHHHLFDHFEHLYHLQTGGQQQKQMCVRTTSWASLDSNPEPTVVQTWRFSLHVTSCGIKKKNWVELSLSSVFPPSQAGRHVSVKYIKLSSSNSPAAWTTQLCLCVQPALMKGSLYVYFLWLLGLLPHYLWLFISGGKLAVHWHTASQESAGRHSNVLWQRWWENNRNEDTILHWGPEKSDSC